MIEKHEIHFICDPFYRNEMLLCKTPNRDTAKTTCGSDFFIFYLFSFIFLRFLQNHECYCVLSILLKFLNKI